MSNMNTNVLEEQLVKEVVNNDAANIDVKPIVETSSVSNPESVIQVSDKTSQTQVSQIQPPQESWKYMREELERAREEKAEAIRYAKELEKLQTQTNKQSRERYSKLREDEFPEAKHFNSQQEDIEEEKARREASEKRMYDMIVENRLMTEHPDIKTVLSPENIAKLTKLEPEIAASIAANPDPYLQHKAAMKAIKTYVIPEVKNEAKELEMKAQNTKMVNNLTKPMPTTSATNSPSSSPINTATAFASGLLTQERKDEIWKDYVQSTGNKYLNFK
jgi:hypothetical protein